MKTFRNTISNFEKHEGHFLDAGLFFNKYTMKNVLVQKRIVDIKQEMGRKIKIKIEIERKKKSSK